MHLMLQAEPDDYVIATGETHSVREFCERAFGEVDLDYEHYVRTDEKFLRPAEVDLLVGDATKAQQELGWKPEYTFAGLVSEMVQNDLAAIENPAPAASA
jgi:GDPmannose 4,6-dehydratase